MFSFDLKKMLNKKREVFISQGTCPVCEKDVKFFAENEWLRDHYFCNNCKSIPRERALMEAIKNHYPNWKNAKVHESSPANRGVSVRLNNECKGYIPSQYFENAHSGQIINGVRSENLESLSFKDNSIDLHITQDVLEHVFYPEKVFSEIARTLTPKGMHIFTVPLVNKWTPSSRRASICNGSIEYLKEPSYHGNPVGDGKSLVTIDWGFDICEYIFKSSGLFTQILFIDDTSKGIRAEYIEVLVSYKPEEKTLTI